MGAFQTSCEDGGGGRRRIVIHAAVLGAYALLTLALTWPLLRDMDSALIGQGSDVYINPWADWWTEKSLTEGMSFYHSEYIFAPDGVSLVFHSFNHVNTAISILLTPLLGPLAAYNVTILLAYTLSGFCTYLLVKRLTGCRTAAFISGLIYAFNPYHLFESEHANLVSMQWIPLFVLAFIRMLRETGIGRVKQVLLAGLWILLASLSCWHFMTTLLIWVLLYLLLYEIMAIAGLFVKVWPPSSERLTIRDDPDWKRFVAQVKMHWKGVVFTMVLVGLWYVLFAWYSPVSRSPRFFLPLAPIVHFTVVSILVFGARMVLNGLPRPEGRLRVTLVTLCYSLLAGLMVFATVRQSVSFYAAGTLTDPCRVQEKRNAEGDAVLEWLMVQEGGRLIRLLYGPSTSLPDWRYAGRISTTSIPVNLNDWGELCASITQHRLSWAIVDADMIVRRPHILTDSLTISLWKVKQNMLCSSKFPLDGSWSESLRAPIAHGMCFVCLFKMDGLTSNILVDPTSGAIVARMMQRQERGLWLLARRARLPRMKAVWYS